MDSSSSEKVWKSGFLAKLPLHSLGVTRRRLFKLTDNGLAYFDVKKGKEKRKNKILLSNIVRVEKGTTKKPEICVQAMEASSNVKLRMFAGSAEEVDEWVAAIAEAVERRKQEDQASESNASPEAEEEEADGGGSTEADGLVSVPEPETSSPDEKPKDVPDQLTPQENAENTDMKGDSGSGEISGSDSRSSSGGSDKRKLEWQASAASVMCVVFRDSDVSDEDSDDESIKDEETVVSKIKSLTRDKKQRSDSRGYLFSNSFDLPDAAGYRPLHRACQEGNAGKVLELLELSCDIESRDEEKEYPPLFHAYTNDHKEILKILLEKGALVDKGDKKSGATLLHFCAKRSDMEVATLLLDNKANINEADWSGKSALHVACLHASFEFIKFLLDRGADVNIEENENGLTALHIASERGNVEVVRLLLSHGASAQTLKSDRRPSAYEIAVDSKHEKIAELLKEALPDDCRPYKCETMLKGHQESISSVAFSEKMVASGAGDGKIILWDPKTGQKLHTLCARDSIVSLCFWGQFLAVGSQLASVFDLKSPGWKLELGLSSGTITDKDRPLQMVTFSADGHLATADIDRNVVEIWSIAPMDGLERRPLHTIVADDVLRDRDGVCQSMQFSPDPSETLLALSIQPGSTYKPVGNNLIHVYNWKSEKLEFCIDTDVGVSSRTNTDTALAFSVDGKYIAAGLSTGLVKIWEVHGYRRLMHQLENNRGCGVRSLAFSPLYGHLAVGMDSGVIDVYSLATGMLLFVLTEGKKATMSLAFSSDGQSLLSGCEDRLVRIYKAPTERPEETTSLIVKPSYPPTKALTVTGELTNMSKEFWTTKFRDFDDDKDGFLNLYEFDRLYCEFKNDHILPDDYEGICKYHGVNKLGIDTLFKLVADWLRKDSEQMWPIWEKNGYPGSL